MFSPTRRHDLDFERRQSNEKLQAIAILLTIAIVLTGAAVYLATHLRWV